MATVDHSMPINGMTVPSNRLLPRQLESARFRTLTIWIGVTVNIPPQPFHFQSLNHYNYTIPPDFFSFFDEIKPRCQRLKYKPDRDSQDLGPLNIVKMFRPSCVHYAQTSPLFYYRFPVYQIPMAFDSLRQLAALVSTYRIPPATILSRNAWLSNTVLFRELSKFAPNFATVSPLTTPKFCRSMNAST